MPALQKAYKINFITSMGGTKFTLPDHKKQLKQAETVYYSITPSIKNPI